LSVFLVRFQKPLQSTIRDVALHYYRIRWFKIPSYLSDTCYQSVLYLDGMLHVIVRYSNCSQCPYLRTSGAILRDVALRGPLPARWFSRFHLTLPILLSECCIFDMRCVACHVRCQTAVSVSSTIRDAATGLLIIVLDGPHLALFDTCYQSVSCTRRDVSYNCCSNWSQCIDHSKRIALIDYR
jgi:hypothetical protein